LFRTEETFVKKVKSKGYANERIGPSSIGRVRSIPRIVVGAIVFPVLNVKTAHPASV